ncbi:MAG: L-Ala-D/L-Glu epimerase [Clostridia bacterium]|nr:L-Ala-D/L-Glu epimerase [Clostridia bacterium]
MLTKIEVFDLRLPLKVPYHTAIAEIAEFTTLVVRLEDEAGREGYGETTTILGYSWEGPEDAWNFALERGPLLLGKETGEAYEKLAGEQDAYPFSVTPWLTALEVLEEEPLLRQPDRKTTVPLVGIINAARTEDIPEKVEEALAAGYQTLKFKAGFDVEDDIRRVRALQQAVAGRAKIRIDANQGYNFEQAARFVTSVDPAGIELFEQPFEEDAWQAMVELARKSPLPLMLDESIYHLEDVERAAGEKCAHYLKFKLMKAGSARNMARYIKRAQELGLKVVLGNGVAADLGCYHEALVAANLGLETAGEENGFLKPREPLFVKPLEFRNGSIILDPDFKPQIDRSKLEAYCLRRAAWQV